MILVLAELPSPDRLDPQGNAEFQRVWDSQFLLRAIPALGLPILAVSTALVAQSAVGVQIVASGDRPGNDSLSAFAPQEFWGSSEETLWIGGGNGFAQITATGLLRTYHQLDGLDIGALVEYHDEAI